MKHYFKIENLDCAHCAAKIEEALSRLEGVEKANVNYLSEKITVVSELDAELLFESLKAIAAKTEPDCRVFRI